MAIITLSRRTFSGAGELAQRVSEKLGYRLVSRDDIIEKTTQYGLSGDRQNRARRRRFGLLPRMDLEWKHYYDRYVPRWNAVSSQEHRTSIVYILALMRFFAQRFAPPTSQSRGYRGSSPAQLSGEWSLGNPLRPGPHKPCKPAAGSAPRGFLHPSGALSLKEAVQWRGDHDRVSAAYPRFLARLL